ncbi:MAG TPA: sugar nucleotide-binding protein [Ilumatobacteraceae bacterium]|nr:sugar nucleotide-binding protein [Ilumatobacteraceae bacterium]
MRWKPRRKRFLLVTGASGFLGRHLVMASEADDWELFAPPLAMVDVRQRDRVIEEIRAWSPNAIVHLAFRRGDRRTNVEGARHIAEAATACNARLVTVSSDAIFPGRSMPYRERDSPFPITEQGVLAMEAERAIAAECPTAVIVRTSLLYGTTWPAPIQNDVERALKGRSNMAFFTDEFRCPAHAADVAAALSSLAGRPDVHGPLNVAGPECVSRAHLAETFARWMGFDSRMIRTTTLAMAGMVRPTYVDLDTTLANSYGLRCRSLAESLPFAFSS